MLATKMATYPALIHCSDTCQFLTFAIITFQTEKIRFPQTNVTSFIQRKDFHYATVTYSISTMGHLFHNLIKFLINRITRQAD